MSFPTTRDSIIPGNYGGYCQAGTPETRSFPTSCRRQRGQCRLVALLGTDDYHSNASPRFDGWFISDFYYLYHAFSQVTNAQHWLTCLWPHDLVEKYGPYIHGDPDSPDMLIVLDKKICRNLRRILVYTIETLIGRFLAMIHEESKVAVEKRQNLTIILCGHGLTNRGDLLIGNTMQAAEARYLTLRMILENVVAGTQVTIVSTACSSGTWVVSPQNFTIFAAASPEGSSWSWPETIDGDATGSMFVSAIVASLTTGDEGEFSGSTTTSLPSHFQGSRTVASLAAVIHLRYHEDLVRTEPSEDCTTSCVQDDAWQLASSRLGICFLPLRERLGLQRASYVRGSANVLSASEVPDLGGDVIMQLVREYLESHPGPRRAGENISLFGAIRTYLKRDMPMDQTRVQGLAAQLLFRVRLAKRATAVASFLPGERVCEQWDWRTDDQSYERVRYRLIWDTVFAASLLPEPRANEGVQDTKPHRFLVQLCYNLDWEADKLVEVLSRIKETIDNQAPGPRPNLNTTIEQSSSSFQLTSRNSDSLV